MTGAAVAVRPAPPADAPAAAGVITEALRDKYAPALGARAADVVAALIRDELREPGPSRYWVAEISGSVVGAVHLQLGPGDAGGLMRRLAEEVGALRALRATLVFGLLGEGGREPGEAYVDELGVDASARRRGVGRALLAACEAEARRAGRSRLTLWVTMNNAGARRLYEGAGFSVRRRRRWLLGRLVFGAPGALFMEKPL